MSKIVRPVTGFPAQHALVKDYNCYSEGDPIPHAGIDSECKAKVGNFDSSAKAFYSLSKPKGSSSNIGFEEHDATTLFFVVDDQGKGMFVINYDKPGKPRNPDYARGRFPRYATMTIGSQNLAGVTGISTLIKDDVSEFGEWDISSGTLSPSKTWKWSDCCTDGGVLGYLPSSGYCLELKWSKLDGMIEKGIRIGTYDGLTNTMGIVSLDTTVATTGSGLEACAELCSDVCKTLSEVRCREEDACAWCNSECMPDSNEDGTADKCDVCPDYSDSGQCEDAGDECAWCNDSCMPDSDGNGTADKCETLP